MLSLQYKDFLDLLNKHNITIQEIAQVLGYSKYSIQNNWKAKNEIPKLAETSLKIYIELLKAKKENQELKKRLQKKTSSQMILSSEIFAIAEAKCTNNNISLKEYISSLIVANI